MLSVIYTISGCHVIATLHTPASGTHALAFLFFSCPKRVPEITVPRNAAPAFLCATGGKPRTVTVRGVCPYGGLCSRPQTGEVFCLHVCQQPTLRWESSQSLIHSLCSCVWLGLQIDLHKRPSPLLGTPLFFSTIACRDQDQCE